ncbi:MAG: N-acetyl-gamma-glutamyl-phosphate reductase [Gammaproteobacteria bacterium]|nr:N-acetyl-gamma-glutamyl-phosphate reductase [Gammaproteobacteria bacterium]
MNKIRIGIIGGTGYTGVELLRLLANHPHAELVCITSRGEEGTHVASLFPSLRGHYDLTFEDPARANLAKCNLVFCATPNGVAMQHAPDLLDAGVKVVDLSADFRIDDVNVWEDWYGMKHVCPERISEAVYGLPEVNRDEIKTAMLVANPGCYPTAVQLGFLPLVEHGLVDVSSLIADAKSGVSGAGRKAAVGTALCEVGDSFKAYSASGHRHLPEIKQGLQLLTDQAVGLVFTPHLLPMIRGIHGTLYGKLTGRALKMTESELLQVFRDRFELEPFVDIMPLGSHPDTRSVRGSNHCRIAIHRPQGGDTVVVLVVEDNLVKGAAGQAIQNMNLMCGLSETDGINNVAIVP